MKKILLFALLLSIPFAAIPQDSLNVSLLYQWSDNTLPASFVGNTYNEVWGFVQGGREYAVIGTTMGTHIFDVTTPTASTLVVFIPGPTQGQQIIHRDYHDYNGYLYMVTDEGWGVSTLEIADLSFLPSSAPIVYSSNTLFSISHNIFIDTAKARLYACSPDYITTLGVYDISTPANPVFLGTVNLPDFSHDIFVRNDTAWINVGGSGLLIYDVSNVSSPQLIGSLTSYPHQGYNHSGWLNDDGSVYALADEDHGLKVKVLNVSNLGNIQLHDTIGTEVHPLSIPHNLIIKGDYLFVSYYYDGFYIWDISDPNNPVITGWYDTCTLPHQNDYEGAWGVYPLLPSGIVLVSDMQEGLFVFDVSQAVSIGVKEQDNPPQLRIFPNPTTGVFTVTGATEPVQVFDLLGRQVKPSGIPARGGQAGSSIHFDLSSYPAGIYFVKVGDAVRKLVKQ